MHLLRVLAIVTAGFAQVSAFSQEFRPLKRNRPTAEVLNTSWDVEGEIDWEVVSSLAWLSFHVYDNDHVSLDRVYSAMGFDEWAEIRKDSTVAHVLVSKDILAVSFRGSDDLDDWILNARIRRVACNGEIPFYIHSGFTWAYSKIRSELRDAVVSKAKDRRLWLCGHSQGGAIAVLCAIDIEHGVSTPKPMLVTFGQPQLTESIAVEWIDRELKGRYARVVNGQDFVTRIPGFMGYKHAGRLIPLGDAKEAAKASAEEFSTTEEINLNLGYLRRNRNFNERYGWEEPDQIKTATREGWIPHSLLDHKLMNYITRIEKNLDAGNLQSLQASE